MSPHQHNKGQKIVSPRRNSLGFDMARIRPNQPPLPRIFEDSSTISQNNDLDLQHIRRLQSINQNLRKQVTQTEKGANEDDIHSRISKVEERFNSDLSTLNDTLKALETEKKELIVKMEVVEEDLTSLRRSLKGSNAEVHGLNVQIATAEAKFDFMEEKVMKTVLQKEKSLNEMIEKLQKQNDVQLQVIESQLKQELEQNRDYKDENMEKNIATLKAEKEKLELTLELAKLKKIEQLKKEEELMENEIQKYLQKHIEVQNRHVTEIELKRRRLDGVDAELNTVAQSIGKKDSQIEECVKKADFWRSKEATFGERKLRLKHHENQLQGEMLRVQLQENEWDTKLMMTREQFQEMEAKNLKQKQHILTMEDSILNHKKKVRMYIRVPKVEDSEKITIEGREFMYDKVFSGRSFCEAQMMLKSSLKGNNCTVYFAGTKGGDLLDFVVNMGEFLVETGKKFPGWLFVYSLESNGKTWPLESGQLQIWATNGETVDSGNIDTKEMEEPLVTALVSALDSAREIRIVIEASNLESNKAFDSWISLMDVTKLALPEQDSVIRAHVDSQSKHLVICNAGVEANVVLLDIFESLGHQSTQYVHREML